MIDGVLFDLFHTLVILEDDPGPTTAELLGLNKVAWNRAIFGSADHHALGTVSDPYESLKKIVDLIDPSVPEEKIRRAVAARPQRFRRTLLHPRREVIETLDAVRATGVKTALVSNAGYDEIEAWDESPLAARFDAALFSCHEKRMKPDPAIYRRTAERIGVACARCLFVGDGGSDEHAGASSVGMKTVLYLAMIEATHPTVAAVRPRDTDYEIGALGELVALVERLRLS